MPKVIIYIFGYCPPIRFINHHRAHAASAFYASGFDEAMIFTTDLSGDGISTTLSYGKSNKIDTLKTYKKLPVYRLLSSKGPKHNPIFKISVVINGSRQFIGLGNSKKQAQQDGAKNLLKNINIK